MVGESDGRTWHADDDQRGTRSDPRMQAPRVLGRLTVISALLTILMNCGGSPTAPQFTLPEIDLVGAGDIAACTVWSEKTALLLDAIPGTVITMGDNAYEDGTLDEYHRCYQPTWGRHRARTRPTPGNHDYHLPGAPGYFTYFGDSAGTPGEGYYSFDLEGWHVVAYNSVVDIGESSTQIEWLKSDLQAAASECVLAYGYHPRFSSGWHGDEEKMSAAWAVFQDFGVDVVLSGHDHDYERFAPLDKSGEVSPDRGIRQFVVGTGGAGIREIERPTAGSEARLAGILRLPRSDRDRPGAWEVRVGVHHCGGGWRIVDLIPATEPRSAASAGKCHSRGMPNGHPVVLY